MHCAGLQCWICWPGPRCGAQADRDAANCPRRRAAFCRPVAGASVQSRHEHGMSWMPGQGKQVTMPCWTHQALCCEGNALRVVACRGADDTPRALLIIELGYAVVGAPQLEGEHSLQHSVGSARDCLQRYSKQCTTSCRLSQLVTAGSDDRGCPWAAKYPASAGQHCS